MRENDRIILITTLSADIPILKIIIKIIIIFLILTIIITAVYTYWYARKLKRLDNILNEECNPLKYIEEYEKFRRISNRISFQNA